MWLLLLLLIQCFSFSHRTQFMAYAHSITNKNKNIMIALIIEDVLVIFRVWKVIENIAHIVRWSFSFNFGKLCCVNYLKVSNLANISANSSTQALNSKFSPSNRSQQLIELWWVLGCHYRHSDCSPCMPVRQLTGQHLSNHPNSYTGNSSPKPKSACSLYCIAFHQQSLQWAVADTHAFTNT